MLFSITQYKHHPYTSSNHKNTNRKEEPKESLGIVTEIAAIIFLVAFTDFLPFIIKHGIDLTDAENGGYPPTQNGDIRSLF